MMNSVGQEDKERTGEELASYVSSPTMQRRQL